MFSKYVHRSYIFCFCFWYSLLILSSISDRTPLHHSAICQHFEGTKLLLSFNADVNARDKEYCPRFRLMISKHELPSYVVFCFWYSLLILSSISHRTPIHHSAICGHCEVTELLLTSNADVNAIDNEYRPRLCHMFSKYDQHIFRWLLCLRIASHLLFNQLFDRLTSLCHWGTRGSVLYANFSESWRGCERPVRYNSAWFAFAWRFSPLTHLFAVMVALPSNVLSTTTKPTWSHSFAAFALLNKWLFVTRCTCADDDALPAATFVLFWCKRASRHLMVQLYSALPPLSKRSPLQLASFSWAARNRLGWCGILTTSYHFWWLMQPLRAHCLISSQYAQRTMQLSLRMESATRRVITLQCK